MTNEVSLQQRLQEKVSESIRSTFIDLIPKEEFDKMVGAALNEFLHGSTHARSYKGPNYNVYEDPNTLPGMLMNSLRGLASEHIKGVLATENFQEQWNGVRQTYDANAVIKQVLTNNPEVIVSALFSSITSNIMARIRNDLQNGRML